MKYASACDFFFQALLFERTGIGAQESYVASAEFFASETQLSRRVSDWQERLAPVLDAEANHSAFDIHRCAVATTILLCVFVLRFCLHWAKCDVAIWLSYGQTVITNITQHLSALGLDPQRVAAQAAATRRISLPAATAPATKGKGRAAPASTSLASQGAAVVQFDRVDSLP